MRISEVNDDIVFIAILKCNRQDHVSVSINCDQFLQSLLRAGMANTMEFCQLLSSFQHGQLDCQNKDDVPALALDQGSHEGIGCYEWSVINYHDSIVVLRNLLQGWLQQLVK